MWLPWLLSGFWLLSLHFLCYMGLGRLEPLSQRLGQYPTHFLEIYNSGVFLEMLQPLGLTIWYLVLATVLAWILLLLLRQLPVFVLEFLGSIPAFITVFIGVFITILIGQVWDLGLWLDGNHPWMQFVLAVGLALPISSRAANILKLRSAEYQQALFSQVARGMGIPEARVRFKAFRAALPEGALALSGEALGVVASLMLIEGSLQFPGIGKAAFIAFQGISGGIGGTTPEDVQAAVARASASLLLLFLVAGLYAGLLHLLVQRLEPRSR